MGVLGECLCGSVEGECLCGSVEGECLCGSVEVGNVYVGVLRGNV